MSKKKRTEENNPAPVTADLCAAYRATLEEKINGLRNTIIVGLSISTTIITIVMYILQILLK